LTEQFSRLGIRQVELDVFADPDGGHFASPSARSSLRKAGKEPGPDPNDGGRLAKPGLKVLHVQDVDYLSTVSTFLAALKEIRSWSITHPRHVPILVLVELNDQSIPTLPTRPVSFSSAELDGVDAEIRSVFDSSALFTPDQLRGDDEALPQAIKKRGWPTLGECRGKVLFALDNEGSIRDSYLAGHPALQGRAMFVSVAPDHPAAAWMKVNDAVRDFDKITALVRARFLVRTRADSDTIEARRNDSSRRDKALASGAQFVSTDFPEPRPAFSEYVVRLAGSVVARVNPISGDSALKGKDLDDASTGSKSQ
jgi:Phosphoinositide phospholipase C, Ca2+-dependent